MKILHTSDWHLGALDGDKSLWDDQKFFIDKICDIVKEKSVDAVIIAGDVYDRSVASADAIKLYDYAMTRLCTECKSNVIVIAGNHDSADRLSSCSELLSTAGLHILGSLKRDIQKVSYDEADIYLLPWITEERVKSVFSEKKEEITSLEKAYNVVTDNIRNNLDKTKKNIIVSHSFITNSETSTSDRAAEIGFASQVSASVFDGFDYVALGHIHKPQSIRDNIRYSGTPMPYSFGKEEKQTKSVTIIDTNDMSKEIVPLPLLHKRITFEGKLDELLNIECSKEDRNAYVRVRVTDSYVGLETLSTLREVFPNLLEVSGKRFDKDDSTVTMTMEEFEKLESNPIEIFKQFCREEMDIEIEKEEHLLEMFEKAMNESENSEI